MHQIARFRIHSLNFFSGGYTPGLLQIVAPPAPRCLDSIRRFISACLANCSRSTKRSLVYQAVSTVPELNVFAKRTLETRAWRRRRRRQRPPEIQRSIESTREQASDVHRASLSTDGPYRRILKGVQTPSPHKFGQVVCGGPVFVPTISDFLSELYLYWVIKQRNMILGGGREGVRNSLSVVTQTGCGTV